MADRGDPLVSGLARAMGERFQVVEHLDVELSAAERLLVAASTFRPGRRSWTEHFFKSNLGVRLRSRRAQSLLATRGAHADVVFQTHALFEVADPRAVLYIDCTHRQSMEHWPDWNPLRGRALRSWLERERRQYQESAHVFAFSHETASSVVGDYGVPADRVSVVGAGLNFDRLPDLVERRDGPPTLLFVGNDFERKGGPQLLRAFAALHHLFPGLRLRVVGTAHPIHAQPGVEVLGRIRSRERMSQLYAEADVFCLPSHYDPFPGALLEAMAHALPCVVTASCGIPEIVGRGRAALTVRHGEPMIRELTEALEHLLLDRRAATEMGLAARRRVEDQFLWPHVVDRMAPVIERVAAGQVGARGSTEVS